LNEPGDVGCLLNEKFVVVVSLHAVLLVNHFVDTDESPEAREDESNFREDYFQEVVFSLTELSGASGDSLIEVDFK